MSSIPFTQINLHNTLVHMVASRGLTTAYRCWLPETPVEMDVKEFSQSDAIFSKKTDDFSMDHLFLSIMRSRHQLSLEDPTTSLCHVGPTLQFDMEKLEGDVVKYFIAGKPHLKGVEKTIRRPFRFRNLEKSSHTPGTG